MQPGAGEDQEIGPVTDPASLPATDRLALAAIGAGGKPALSETDILSSVKAPGSVAPSHAANPLGRVRHLIYYFMIATLRCALTGKAVATSDFPSGPVAKASQ